jgi:hypothetical protein
MTQFPSKVKNVSVYQYIDWPEHGGIGPVLLPLLTGAEGTYYIGSLITSIFYNLDLSGGKLLPENGTIEVHGRYTATGQFEDGSPFSTPVWEYCLEAGASPRFGRTLTNKLSADSVPGESGSLALSVPAYGVGAPLTDITVSYSTLLDPIVVKLIENASGNIIYSLAGTPHIMGVRVDGGKRTGKLNKGMQNILITGKNKEGHLYTVVNETCFDNGDPAIFFRVFFPE